MLLTNFQHWGLFELGIGLGIALLLMWLVVGIWAYRDMRRRSRSLAWAIGVFFLVVLLPIWGLVAYLLLRPPETILDRYDRSLRQEMQLQQIEAGHNCPGCNRPTQTGWLVCPECHTTLRRICAHCGTAMELHWQICPVCTHVVESTGTSVQSTTAPLG